MMSPRKPTVQRQSETDKQCTMSLLCDIGMILALRSCKTVNVMLLHVNEIIQISLCVPHKFPRHFILSGD